MPLALALRRHRWWLLAAVGLLFAAVLLAAAALSSRAGTTAPTSGPAPQGPVVLVPGYGGGTAGLDDLATTLRGTGRQATVLHLVGDGTGDLMVQARLLQTTVDGLLAGGAPSVDVVGYSAGGIVARLWADELGGAAHARRIVLLGSPNHGTSVAALAAGFGSGLCPAACQQLVPGSSLLAALDDAGTSGGPQWVSIWTDQDEVVTPPESARLDGATDLTVQSVCPDELVDHGSLPTNPVVQGLVVRALGPAAFVAPSPRECGSVRVSS